MATSGLSPTAGGELDHAGVVALAPRLYGATFVLGLFLNLLWPQPMVPSAVGLSFGLPLILAGATLAVWANHAMRRAGTHVNPSLPATALVVSGPFRFSRNPLYVARTLLYIGLAFAMNVLWPLLFLGPLLVVIQHGVIQREERYLDARFGNAYRQYQAGVRRWL